MTRLTARLLAPTIAFAAAMLAVSTPLAAQQQPSGGFRLPEASPTPTPRPAGPADERAGVVIPPRSVPTPRIVPQPVLTPEPLASPSPRITPTPAPSRSATAGQPRPAASPTPTLPVRPLPSASPSISTVPAPLPSAGEPLPLPSPLPLPTPDAPAPRATEPAVDALLPVLPQWWPWAAGGLGGLALIGGGALLLRRRKPKVLRLAPALAAAPEPEAEPTELPRLDLTLDITGATRSVMMFTLHYRLNIANRSDRAVNDLALGVELACARASANNGRGNAPSPGAAQALAAIARVGPHQARSITGTVQLPLNAIQPLRQGAVPMFVPLVHVTFDGEGQRAFSRSFVIGPPSPHGAGRVHPIALDQPPGAILGLVAQSVTIPTVSAAA